MRKRKDVSWLVYERIQERRSRRRTPRRIWDTDRKRVTNSVTIPIGFILTKIYVGQITTRSLSSKEEEPTNLSVLITLSALFQPSDNIHLNHSLNSR